MTGEGIKEDYKDLSKIYMPFCQKTKVNCEFIEQKIGP